MNLSGIRLFFCSVITCTCAFAFISAPVEVRRLFQKSLKLAPATSMPEWDPALGVWMGDKAFSLETMPNPLYLFGYGSLLWRPGKLLGDFPSFPCFCTGWKRVFAQRSCDHRGTPDFPGLAVTLVADTFLRENGCTSSDHTSVCTGLVWIVPDEKMKETIDELDYRERGGYHRHIIKVTLQSDTPYHCAGDEVDAVVYSGSTSNPNFYMPPILQLKDPQIEGSECDTTMPLSRCRNTAADIIAASVGNSGANSEYLFRLCDFMEANGLRDDYLMALAEDVTLRMGAWRGLQERLRTKENAHIEQRLAELLQASTSPATYTDEQGLIGSATATATVGDEKGVFMISDVFLSKKSHGVGIPHESPVTAMKRLLKKDVVLGWGSNEFGQLGLTSSPESDPEPLIPEAVKLKLLSDADLAVVADADDTIAAGGRGDAQIIPPRVSHSSAVYSSVLVADLVDPNDPPTVQLKKSAVSQWKPDPSRRECEVNRVQESVVFFDYSDFHHQVVCGGATSALLDPSGMLVIWGKDTHTSSGIDTGTGAATGAGTSAGPTPLVLPDIAGVSIGHSHTLVLHKSGWVLSAGDDSYGQCHGPETFVRSFTSLSEVAAVLNDERSEEALFTSAPFVKVMKLSAGVFHSAAVTEDGYLYTWGRGAGGQLFSTGADQSVPDSHTVEGGSSITELSGIDAYLARVRRDQLAGLLEQKKKEKPVVGGPWRPADGAAIVDVSCGLHHTVVVDSKGRIWSFGDNKHGSLGREIPKDVSAEAEQVLSKSGKVSRSSKQRDNVPRLVEGLEPGVKWQRVSCGWSHTLARGLHPDASPATAAWGRSDLGQYPFSTSKDIPSTSSNISAADDKQLAPLPNGMQVREIWAGSEFTLVADYSGLLWSCGWNEHGNLSRGGGALSEKGANDGGESMKFETARNWVPVVDKHGKQVELSVVWEGALACGGGHVICLPNSKRMTY